MIKVVNDLVPAFMMVGVQAATAGVNIAYELAASRGMSMRIFIAYRLILAAAIIVPLALVVERKNKPKLTWVVVFQAFLAGLLGCSLFFNLLVQSLLWTSTTFASAMYNLVPSITFILAILLGLEKLKLNTMAGKAKVIGTLTSLGGATILILYKGTEINIWSTNINILIPKHGHVAQHEVARQPVGGAGLALCFCFSFALYLIVQAKMLQRYPRPYLTTAMTMSMGGVQATVFALCVDRNWDDWKLGWDVRLLAVSFTGIIGSAAAFTLMNWCVRARGPVFVASFNPLMLIFVIIAASLLIDEKLHVGSVLGSGIIIFGLYAVLWGKSRELRKSVQSPSKIEKGEKVTEFETIENEVKATEEKLVVLIRSRTENE